MLPRKNWLKILHKSLMQPDYAWRAFRQRFR